MIPIAHFLPMQRRRATAVALAFASLAVLAAAPSDAVTLHSRDEIPALAFPDSDRVETRNIFLTDGQRDRIEALAGSKLESELVTVYEGYREDQRLGFAMLDSHMVRTLSEALLIVLGPSGEMAATYIMAFHEPTEYMPGQRWLALLEDKGLSADLRVGRGIVGITGATLSARAVVAAVRRALAIHTVVLGEGATEN